MFTKTMVPGLDLEDRVTHPNAEDIPAIKGNNLNLDVRTEVLTYFMENRVKFNPDIRKDLESYGLYTFVERHYDAIERSMYKMLADGNGEVGPREALVLTVRNLIDEDEEQGDESIINYDLLIKEVVPTLNGKGKKKMTSGMLKAAVVLLTKKVYMDVYLSRKTLSE